MAAELARNNVGGPGDVPANSDQPPDPFDKLSKLEYKHLARKLDIQFKTNRVVSILKSKLEKLFIDFRHFPSLEPKDSLKIQNLQRNILNQMDFT